MTTKSRTVDRRYVLADPNGGAALVGELFQWSGSGSDAITTAKPRSSYTRVVRSPREWEQFRKSLTAEARKRAQRRLLLPPQPYTMTHYHSVASRQRITVNGGPLIYISGPADPFPVNPPPVPVDQEYKLMAKLRTKVYGSGFNPAVFTAEGREALGMIGSSATRIRLSIGSLLRRDWRGLVRHLSVSPDDAKSVVHSRKNISGQWLELSYGWLPLLSDMEDGGAYLGQNLTTQDYGNNKVVGRRQFSVVEHRVPDAYGYTWTTRETTFRLQYIIYSVRKSPIWMPSVATVASVVWEKLPYSFVADWVIPIGSYIEAMRTATDLKGKVVRSLKTSMVWSGPSFGSKVRFYGFWTPFGPVKDQMTFTRTVSEELNPPLPYAGIDLSPTSVFKSWNRAANAVALLAQRKWFHP